MDGDRVPRRAGPGANVSGVPTPVLLGLAAGLAGVIGLELLTAVWSAPPELPVAGVAEREPAGSPAADRRGGMADRREAWAAAALTRPLFAPGRRPEALAPVMAVPVGAGLPRLSEVLIDGERRRAIFAGANGAMPVTAGEGGDVAGFRVQKIEAAQVTLVGPDGVHVVRPSFGASLDLQGPLFASQPGFSAVPTLQGLASRMAR